MVSPQLAISIGNMMIYDIWQLIHLYPIGSMYGVYANIWGILMVNVTIYSIHGSYGYINIYIYIIGVLFPNNPKPKPWPIPDWMVVSNTNHKPKGVFHAAAQISMKITDGKSPNPNPGDPGTPLPSWQGHIRQSDFGYQPPCHLAVAMFRAVQGF